MIATQKLQHSVEPYDGGSRMAKPNVFFLALFGLALLYTFLLSLDILTRSVSMLAGPAMNEIIAATLNPVVGVCIGLVITATLQSSSAVTSILVALVAGGGMSLEQAIPIVMGSNMGTTFTAFLVALSHINSKKEFRKGMAAALLHVLFNVSATLIFYPLEALYRVHSLASKFCATYTGAFFSEETGFLGNWLKSIVSPVAQRLVAPSPSSWIWVLIGFGMLFGCILLFRTVLRILWMGEYERKLNDTVFAHPWQALGWGAGLTAFIHSSTVTTSLSVPLSATGAVNIRKLLPFIIGANIGTTITALMAAIGRSETGVALAFSHFLFNFIAGMLVFSIGPANWGLVQAARGVARTFAKNRSLALMFLVLFFFAAPLLVIYIAVR